MKSPRVLMIIGLFFPAIGGAELQALRLAEALIQKGIDVKVLTRKLPGREAFEMIRTVPVYREIRALSWGKLFGVTYFLSCLWFLFRKRNTYDIIHCHILNGLHSFAAVLLKRLLNKKLIIKVAMAGAISDFALLKKMAFSGVILKQLRHADGLIAICSQCAREALHEGFSPQRIIQIPNGVDIQQFTPRVGAKKIKGRIVFVGTLDYRKNISLLLKSVKMLTDAAVPVTLDIIGRGPDLSQLQRLADSLCIANSISFLGAISEITPFLQRAQVFVLPSRHEGLPNAILEAMACGLPVIASPVGGVPDIIGHRVNGLLTDPDDSGAVSDALREVLENPGLARELGVQARRTVEARFSLSATANQYAELYKALLR